MPPIFSRVHPTHLSELTKTLFSQLDSNAPLDYRQLAAILVTRWQTRNDTLIGIGGGQGAGKSTLGRLIKQAGELVSERIVVLSLDDFYLTAEERKHLANEVHPMFATRGPPGTHNVKELLDVLDSLVAGNGVQVPVFDKGIDDRTGYVLVPKGCQRVVIEGWCVGALPQKQDQLARAVNVLETNKDIDGVWRRTVNNHLAGDYRRLFEKLTSLVYVQVPDLNCIRRWRLDQENDRPPELRKGAKWVDEFVQYYQRITESMLDEMPRRADVVVQLGSNHEVEDLVLR